MAWLEDYSEQAGLSDQLRGRDNHLQLLASGFFGEAGSILAELKKQQRELEAYPHYRHRLLEELGDFLWYFVRIVDSCDPQLLKLLPEGPVSSGPTEVDISLAFAAVVGRVVHGLDKPGSVNLRAELTQLWQLYARIAASKKIPLREASLYNLAKVDSRWPAICDYYPLFDDACPPEDRLPRTLDIEFIERKTAYSRTQVLIRYKGLNIGDRLTDNISEPDAYRYHDVFHMAYAVFLGWSPVTRSLLKCKRKNDPEADENQDGARAAIIEEAVSAIVFSRAKRMNYFSGAQQVDYDLLKSIQEFVQGFEVDSVPIWQWERAILQGFQVFRHLRDDGPGGIVSLDIEKRKLNWSPPTKVSDS